MGNDGKMTDLFGLEFERLEMEKEELEIDIPN